MDYDALRAKTLGSGTDEEAVTVNTRALIDKVLARYSGEWTVLRELLQNAADASATKVVIKFETIPSATHPLPSDTSASSRLKQVVQHHTLRRLVVSNNGHTFTEHDWTRLKRIAEGNPDETKIGAFGVGFYSTFADCDEPFVQSGKEAMAFFWKANSLFTRRLQLTGSDASQDTTFVLNYRDATSTVPALLEIAQFLSSSLTFVGIERLELWLDEWKILQLSKKTSPSQDVPIPSEIETKTSEGLMRVQKVTREISQIDGEWMRIVTWRKPRPQGTRLHEQDNAPSLRKFFSRLAGGPTTEDLRINQTDISSSEQDTAQIESTSIFLHATNATLRTFPTTKFAAELERATKKPPPKTTYLAIMTSPFIDSEANIKSGTSSVFATVLPSKSGRIFIGFPTHQTTGLSAHISAPSVIPTVERESIDLNARYVKSWNLELLRAAGVVCRIAWISEMSQLKEKISRSTAGKKKIRLDDISPFLPEGIATANSYTFRESTPAAQIGQILEDAFWTCSKKASIDVLSSSGILPTHEVRVAPKDLSFMEGIPILPDQLVSGAKVFVDKLVDFGLVTEVTVSDISKALEAMPLNSSQVGEFLTWLTTQRRTEKLDPSTVRNLLSVAVAHESSKNGEAEKLLLLGSMQYFLNASKISTDMPVPETVMPFKFTKSIAKKDLEDLGWQELQIVPWLRWLLENAGNKNVLSASQSMLADAAFSTQVLAVVSKQYDSLSQSSRATLIDTISKAAVIPTKLGMRKPSEAYFPNVKLFDDLPTVSGLSNVKDKFLALLGVRKTVELGMVFDRLLSKKEDNALNGQEKHRANHVDLIQYLVSVREDIPGADIQKLKSTPICFKETNLATKADAMKRYRVSELFEPRPVFRELGLPILSWPGLYRGGSPEGKFLAMLGLRNAPTVAELVDIMAHAGDVGDAALREKAMNYFLSNHHANGYALADYSKITRRFLPLENDSKRLSTPSQCFCDGGAALLGFDILKAELQQHATRFGVRTHPQLDLCIDVLVQKPPPTYREAKAIFGYFAGRLNEVQGPLLTRLSTTRFIPITSRDAKESGKPKYVAPQECFLGDSDTFGDIFSYVDFGQEANTFLLRCGSKLEPTKVEIAQLLVREPARISSTFGNAEKYLALLRTLADSLATLKKNKQLFADMKRAPFLLASKELAGAPIKHGAKSPTKVEDIDDLEEDDVRSIREWQLTTASDAIVVDDYMNYRLFKNSILAAPQEEQLEDFYIALGSPLLSSLVEEAAKHGPRASDQQPAKKLQKVIFERAQLFLHDQPIDTVKHDTRWLERNLQVQLVSSISLRRSLKDRNISHVEKRSAVVTQTNREYTLWITGEKPDFYQVSQALVHLLLLRPKLHSALTLEMLLKTDLLDLRTRGFNVARILRQKAAEARLAESRRQQALEEEQNRIKEQEQAWGKTQADGPNNKSAQKPQPPGGFPETPDRASTPDGPERGLQQQPRGLLSNISRQLGIRDKSRQLQSMLGSANQTPTVASEGEEDPPPPYSNGGAQKNLKPNTVTAPHQLRENLLSAVKKARPNNSTSIFSRGETNTVSETQSYCDERPAHDLTCIAELQHGIQMFLSPSSTPNSSNFLTTHSAGLSSFASLLNSVCTIFSLDPRVINVFFEPHGKTIAFNRAGSIFCNYLYFQSLHEASIARGQGMADAIVYWFVIYCHELAHNLVADHSSNHSFYTEGFVAQYFGKVVEVLARTTGVGTGSGPRALENGGNLLD